MGHQIKKLLLFKNSLNNGFTFLELMITLTIFSIIALGSSNMIMQVEKNIVAAKRNTLACNLCQSKIEELKSFGYKAILNSIEIDIDERGKPGGVFDRVVRVSNGPIPNTKLVYVTVSWKDSIKTKKVSLPTILANISM